MNAHTRASKLRRSPALLPLLIVAAACGSAADPVDGGGTPLPPLEAGVWHLHEVDGRPLPEAVLTTSTSAGVDTLVVSFAYFGVLPGGHLEYRSLKAWHEAGGESNNIGTLATGTWLAGSDHYHLVLGQNRQATLRPSSDGALVGEQTVPASMGGGLIQVVYRPAPPTASSGTLH